MIPIQPDWPHLPAGQLVGLSEDLNQIDRARAMAEQLGRIDCLFAFGNVNEIPWRDAYFDEVYLTGEATAEVRRVLTSEGVIHPCPSMS